MKKIKNLSQEELKQLLMEEIGVLYPKGGTVPGVHKKTIPNRKLYRTGFNPGRADRVKSEKISQQIERYLGDSKIKVEDFYLIKELVEEGKKLRSLTSGDSYQEKNLIKQHLLEIKDKMRGVLERLPEGFHEKWRISPTSNLQELSAFLVFLPQLENSLQDLQEYLVREKESTT